jgi:Zn-dependent M28 family amino/carboxypeptidase
LPTAFDGRSDYQAFQNNGVPAGGLFSGAEQIKTAEQVALFGGTEGLAFDPSYHQAGDGRDNLNDAGWEQMADAATQVAYDYAGADALPEKFRASSTRSTRARSARSGAKGERRGDRLQR